MGNTMPRDLDAQSMCPWKSSLVSVRYPYQQVLAVRAVLGDPDPGGRCYFAGFELPGLRPVKARSRETARNSSGVTGFPRRWRRYVLHGGVALAEGERNCVGDQGRCFTGLGEKRDPGL